MINDALVTERKVVDYLARHHTRAIVGTFMLVVVTTAFVLMEWWGAIVRDATWRKRWSMAGEVSAIRHSEVMTRIDGVQKQIEYLDRRVNDNTVKLKAK